MLVEVENRKKNCIEKLHMFNFSMHCKQAITACLDKVILHYEKHQQKPTENFKKSLQPFKMVVSKHFTHFCYPICELLAHNHFNFFLISADAASKFTTHVWYNKP